MKMLNKFNAFCNFLMDKIIFKALRTSCLLSKKSERIP